MCRSTPPGWTGCVSSIASMPWSSCPATARTPIRCCSPTSSPSMTSPATTCSAATTSDSGRSARWPSGPASCSSAAASATTRSTSWPCANTSGSCSPSASTWSGTWRAAGPGPESCARRAMACWPMWPRPSPGAGPRTPASCRWRSPTTSSARYRPWPRSSPVARRSLRASAGSQAMRGASLPGSARSTSGSPNHFRCARHCRQAVPMGILGGVEVGRDAWRLALQKVAFEVAVRINRVTPVTATALVTLALLGVRDRALTLGQVRGVLGPLRDYLAERGLPYSREILDTDAGVRRVLGALSQQNVVTVYAGGEEPVYAIERGQHLVAAFYRNSAIHHFLDRAVAELVLLGPPADRWDEAMRLRDQLKFEFFFPD